MFFKKLYILKLFNRVNSQFVFIFHKHFEVPLTHSQILGMLSPQFHAIRTVYYITRNSLHFS